MSEHEVSTVQQPHLLCARCQSYWERLTCLSYPMEMLLQGGEDIPHMPQHLLHSQHRSEMVSAAAWGCHFCSILLGTLVGCTGQHDEPNIHVDDPVYISTDILNQADGTFLLTLFPCEQSRIFSHDLILNSFQLRLRPIKTKEATGPNIKSSRLQISTFSSETAEYIKSWIGECQNNHLLCGMAHLNLLGSASSPTRPRRLLDLQAFPTEDKIRLIDAEDGPPLEYCALSYSWGYSRPCRMTPLNVAEFQQEIRVSSLPKTLRDAIQAARAIGFRYMWQDSLCIMQDGHIYPLASADWKDQAGKLHDIFGNAVITIAAAEGADGSQGFIYSRNPLSQTACRLNVCLDLGLDYEVVPPCTPHCLRHTFDDAEYHLDTRGWVFQERILSPRTAHFTRSFLHLECRTELKCEAMAGLEFAEGESDCHHSGSVPKSYYQNLFSTFDMVLPELERSGSELFIGYWLKLVTKYSTTNLSREEDLLIALAGLAKKVHKKSSLTWSFGLWREHLLRSMLWYVKGGKGVPFRGRAPSWSWASVKVQRASIIHIPPRRLESASTVSGTTSNAKGSQLGYESSVDVGRASIPTETEKYRPGPQIMHELLTNVEFVATITALPETSKFTRQESLSEDEESKFSVKIKGPLRSGAPIFAEAKAQAKAAAAAAANIDPLSRTFELQQVPGIYRYCQAMPDIHPDCPFHADIELPDELELYSLLVARERTKPLKVQTGTIPGAYTETGLILTPVGERDGRYRRVGFFHHALDMEKGSDVPETLESFFPDDCKVEEIQIV